MPDIGMIGLGLLGSAMSERLQEAGWTVIGFDLDSDCRAAHASRGGVVAENAVAVVAESDTILLSLPDSDVVETVLADIDALLTPGKTIVDTTTGAAHRVEQTGERLAARGVEYIDATVGGSSQQARQGEAIIMCGATRPAFERCRPLFDVLASQTFHLGQVGSGSRMKLALNLVLGLNRAVLGEGLSFAEACGIDPVVALEVLQAGPASSRVMDTKGQKMLSGDFEPQARLAQHLKDVRLINEAGAAAQARTPLSQLHEQLLSELVDSGLGDLDNSVVIQAFKP